MDQISRHPLYKIYNIDSAMSSLWDFYKKHFIVLFFISLIMALITQYTSTLINFRELQSITDPQQLLLKIRGYIWPMALISVLSLLFSTVLQYYVIFNPLDSDNNIIQSAIKSMRYFVPYLIIMILFAFVGSFVIFLGILALVIGVFFAALYIVTVYFFILPQMIAEGPNIANTISRTITLAHRRFWPNLGWTAVFVLILLVVSVVMSGIVLLPFTGNFIKVIANPEDTSAIINVAVNPVYIILSAIVNALIYPFLSIFSCILYFNARAREEQPVFIEQVKEEDRVPVKVDDLYAKPNIDDPQEIAGDDSKK